jgi:hypothetical protein
MTNDVEVDFVNYDDLDMATIFYGENLNQGYHMMLGNRIRLGLHEMMQVKNIADTNINPDFQDIEARTFTNGLGPISEITGKTLAHI